MLGLMGWGGGGGPAGPHSNQSLFLQALFSENLKHQCDFYLHDLCPFAVVGCVVFNGDGGFTGNGKSMKKKGYVLSHNEVCVDVWMMRVCVCVCVLMHVVCV